MCGELQCRVCKLHFPDEHYCYQRIQTPKEQKFKYIFFYFECTQEHDTPVPNYVVAEMVCEQCEKAPVTGDSTCSSCGHRCPACDKWDRKGNKYVKKPCIGCGKRRVIFEGENTKKLFGSWLFKFKEKGLQL